MNVHVFQHVAFENEGIIPDLLPTVPSSVTRTKLYEDFSMPRVNDIDLLIVMGGPMGVYEKEQYTWLTDEISFVRDYIQSGRKVIGICLGAQIIAEALGAKVYASGKQEIGWYDVMKVGQHKITAQIPESFEVIHWHGDTFDLPVGARHLFRSECFANQGFSFGENVLAFQFHIEMKEDNLQSIIEACGQDLKPSESTQVAKEIWQQRHKLDHCHQHLRQILQNWIN